MKKKLNLIIKRFRGYIAMKKKLNPNSHKRLRGNTAMKKKLNPNSHKYLIGDTSKSWSDLTFDLLNLVFESLSFADFQLAKSVCSSWRSSSRQCCLDMVYKDHKLYLSSYSNNVKIFDFSGEVPQRIVVEEKHIVPPLVLFKPIDCLRAHRSSIVATNIIVRVTGDVLEVVKMWEPRCRSWSFCLYKVYSLGFTKHERVHSLGDEAMLLDLGITVLANDNAGISRNSIYFSDCNNANNVSLFNLKTSKMEKSHKFDCSSVQLSSSRCTCMKTYGRWLLMQNLQLNLYIVNLFTHERINLPPVKSQFGMTKIQSPVFWIDEKTKDHVVSWARSKKCVVYSKTGDNSWNKIPKTSGCLDMVYKDHKLYFSSYSNNDLEKFTNKLLLRKNILYLLSTVATNIIVTVTGDVLEVVKMWEPRCRSWSFCLYKVYSL
ncbi:unnamed protein product [Brassica napus]|uniref:(rape) hypothetical protein n=1 Tax=Brassica napus TaxID=3708 RepID=A0A816NBU0_BRANA|nr:unnamed protein product [Brassica napus]